MVVGITMIQRILSWRFKIVKKLRAANWLIFPLFTLLRRSKPEDFVNYDPGPEYYEWVGYSWWGGDKDGHRRSILPES